MAGFPGNPRRLGSAGIPPAGPPPIVSETSNTGTDTFYVLGIALAEDIAPDGSSYPAVRVTETASNGTDSYFVLGFVLTESGSSGSSGGTFRITETGSVGTDTYFVLGIVLSEQ